MPRLAKFDAGQHHKSHLKPAFFRMKFVVFSLLIDGAYAAAIWTAAVNFERLQTPGCDTPVWVYLLYVALPICLAVMCALGQSFARLVSRHLQGVSTPATQSTHITSPVADPNVERLAQVAHDFAVKADTAGLQILSPVIEHVGAK